MANPIGARKCDSFKAVSTAPSFNKTPVGSSTPPLPYPTTADLSNSVSVVPTVRFNGKPAYVLDQTVQPTCKGDEAGSCGGVRSGTVNGEVKPVKGASTVFAGGKPVIREGDPCTMNGGNNRGIYVTTQAPAGQIAAGRPTTNPNPPVTAGTPEEKGFLDKVGDFFDDVGKGYLEHSTEEVDAELPVPTLKTGEGVGRNIGRVLSQVATDIGDDAREGHLGRPHLPNVSIRPGKARPKPPATSKPSTKEAPRGTPGGTGVTIVGRGTEGDCGIKPYKDQKCPKGQQAHHIVPDYALRYGKRADKDSRIPGMPSLDDGPSICLTGGSKSVDGEHGKAHRGTDPRIEAAGQRTDNGPPGAATIGEIIDISVEEVGKTKPHCKDEIKKKTDEAFKNVDRNKYGRTTQQPPKAGSETHATFSRGDVHDNNGRFKAPRIKR